MDEQRKRVYGYRQRILDGGNCKQLILEMIDEQIDRHLDEFLDKNYGGGHVRPMGRRAVRRRTRGPRFPRARLRRGRSGWPATKPPRMAEGQVFDAIEENLPEDEEPSEWNWEALAKLSTPAGS